MKPADWQDRERAVEIIAETFAENPGVNWLLKKKGNHAGMIRRMAEFAFVKAYVRKGAYLSDNRKGVGLCYRFRPSRFSMLETFHELRFALSCIAPARLPEVLRRESYRNKQRPPDGAYLYFWFLGVEKGGGNAALEIGRGMFDIARRENLPIYLETAVEIMEKVYSRYGFETYHFWEVPEKGIRFWFMRWEP